MTLSLVFLMYIGILSLVAFVFYGLDKRYAVRHAWRVPEKVLLSLGFFGGSCGALLAMQLFRHKTKHYYFYVVNLLGLVWQVILLVFLWVR